MHVSIKKPLQQRQDNTRMCKICVLGSKQQEILLALGPARAHMWCSAYACFQGIASMCNHFAYTNISVVRLYGLLLSSTTSGSLGQKVFRCFEALPLLAPARETRKNTQKSKYRVTLTQFFLTFSVVWNLLFKRLCCSKGEAPVLERSILNLRVE